MSTRKALILLLGTASVIAYSQVATKEAAEHPRGRASIYKDAANHIASANPKVKPQTLAHDLPVVESAEPRLRGAFPATFSDSEVRQINTSAWVDYRAEHPNDKLDLDGFAKLASQSYGGLRITSNPSGASIEVDSRAWDDLTDAQSTCRTGTRHIRLSKDGYEEADGDVLIVEGQWTVFHKDLKKK